MRKPHPRRRRRAADMIPEEVIGTGSQYVYVYFAESERKLASWEGRLCWPCKIGHAIIDPAERILQQGALVSTYAMPKLGLVIKTDSARSLERAIHKILKETPETEVPGALGTEWYLTSPDHIKRLVESGLDLEAEVPAGPPTRRGTDRGITRIIKKAGGVRKISAASFTRESAIVKIGHRSVYQWARSGTGIPERHWSLIVELTGLTLEDIYQANLAARERAPRKKRKLWKFVDGEAISVPRST